MKRFFARLIEGMDLHPVGDTAWHQFPEPAASPASPARGIPHRLPYVSRVRFSVLECILLPSAPDWDFEEELELEFGAVSVEVRRIERPYQSE